MCSGRAEGEGPEGRGGEGREGEGSGGKEKRGEWSMLSHGVRHLRRQCAQALETRTLRRAQQPLVVGLRLHGDARGL